MSYSIPDEGKPKLYLLGTFVSFSDAERGVRVILQQEIFRQRRKVLSWKIGPWPGDQEGSMVIAEGDLPTPLNTVRAFVQETRVFDGQGHAIEGSLVEEDADE